MTAIDRAVFGLIGFFCGGVGCYGFYFLIISFALIVSIKSLEILLSYWWVPGILTLGLTLMGIVMGRAVVGPIEKMWTIVLRLLRRY